MQTESPQRIPPLIEAFFKYLSDLLQKMADDVNLYQQMLPDLCSYPHNEPLIKLDRGLTMFTHLDIDYTSDQAEASAFILPLPKARDQKHIPKYLPPRTREKRPARVVQHFKEQKHHFRFENEKPKLLLKSQLGSSEAFEAHLRELSERRKYELLNELDGAYFESKDILALPITLAGSPLVTVYYDADRFIRAKGGESAGDAVEILERTFSPMVLPYFFSALSQITNDLLLRETNDLLLNDDSGVDYVDSFVCRVAGFLCARSLYFQSPEKTIEESQVLTKYFSKGERIDLESTDGRRYVIQLPKFHNVASAPQPYVEQVAEVIKDQMRFLINIKDRQDDLLRASRAFDRLRATYEKSDKEIRALLLPTARARNVLELQRLPNWLCSVALNLKQGAFKSAVDGLKKKGEAAKAAARGVETWSQNDFGHFVAYVTREVCKEAAASDDRSLVTTLRAIGETFAELGQQVLGADEGDEESPSKSPNPLLAITKLICETWIRLQEGSPVTLLELFKNRIRPDSTYDTGTITLNALASAVGSSFHLLSVRGQWVAVDMRVPDSNHDPGMPPGFYLVLLGSLASIPDEYQRHMTVTMKRSARLTTKIEFQEPREDDRPLYNITPDVLARKFEDKGGGSKFSYWLSALYQFYDIDFSPGRKVMQWDINSEGR